MYKMTCILLLSVFITCVCSSPVLHNTIDVSTIPELKYLNRSANPCDDFYEFTCGNFEKYNPLPPGEKMWDSYYIVQRQIDQIALDIMRSSKRETEPKAVKKAKDMYSACIGYAKYASYFGVEPMASALDKLGGWPLISGGNSRKPARSFSWRDVGEAIAEYGLPFFINWQIVPFPNDATKNMILLSKDALELPSSIISDPDEMQNDVFEDAVLKQSEKMVKKENPYVKYVVKVATALCQQTRCDESTSQIQKDVQDVLNVMIKISNSQKYPRQVNFSKTITTIEELQQWSDTFAHNYKTRIVWLDFFTRAFKNSDAILTKDTNVWLGNSDSLANILDIVEQTDTTVIQNYVFTRLATFMAPDSSPELWEAYNDLYRDTYGDKYPIYARADYCKRKVVNSQLTMAVAYEYQTYYFDNRKIQNAKDMIADLKEAFLDLLNENEWLDEEAKQAAKEKFSKLVELIGFPDFVYDQSKLDKFFKSLRVCRHDHFGNMQRIRAFNMAKSIEVVGHKRDRYIWNNSPMSVNAFYNGQNNRIVFPAAIMNTPFYSGEYSVIDYGRIGAIIGHEITHGFDSKGMNTDGNGNMGAIWSKNISKIFDEKADCFRNQYSNYYIDEIEQFVNGTVTLGENIADNGGIREAYRAYLKVLKRTSRSFAVDEFTSEQMFFIAYGTNWCRVDTLESLATMYKNDNHSPNRFRVRGPVSNMKEFSEVFNCPKGSNMNPEDKCLLW